MDSEDIKVTQSGFFGDKSKEEEESFKVIELEKSTKHGTVVIQPHSAELSHNTGSEDHKMRLYFKAKISSQEHQTSVSDSHDTPTWSGYCFELNTTDEYDIDIEIWDKYESHAMLVGSGILELSSLTEEDTKREIELFHDSLPAGEVVITVRFIPAVLRQEKEKKRRRSFVKLKDTLVVIPKRAEL